MLFCATSLRHTCLSETWQHGHEGSSSAVAQSLNANAPALTLPLRSVCLGRSFRSPSMLLRSLQTLHLGCATICCVHEAHAFMFTSALDSVCRVRVGVTLTHESSGEYTLSCLYYSDMYWAVSLTCLYREQDDLALSGCRDRSLMRKEM
jgi:hypothetical protein